MMIEHTEPGSASPTGLALNHRASEGHMYANLFEHETIPAREKLNRIWDAIPSNLSCSAMEKLFIDRAVAAGYNAETAEAFLIGDPSC